MTPHSICCPWGTGWCLSPPVLPSGVDSGANAECSPCEWSAPACHLQLRAPAHGESTLFFPSWWRQGSSAICLPASGQLRAPAAFVVVAVPVAFGKQILTSKLLRQWWKNRLIKIPRDGRERQRHRAGWSGRGWEGAGRLRQETRWEALVLSPSSCWLQLWTTNLTCKGMWISHKPRSLHSCESATSPGIYMYVSWPQVQESTSMWSPKHRSLYTLPSAWWCDKGPMGAAASGPSSYPLGIGITIAVSVFFQLL